MTRVSVNANIVVCMRLNYLADTVLRVTRDERGDGAALGAAFLVDHDLAVTCAHCLEGTEDPVWLHLSPSRGSKPLTARRKLVGDKSGAKPLEDYAILQIVPPRLDHDRFVTLRHPHSDHEATLWGFPQDAPDGRGLRVRVTSYLSGDSVKGCLKAEKISVEYLVLGFSGSPAITEEGVASGMFVRFKEDGFNSGAILPAEVLIAAVEESRLSESEMRSLVRPVRELEQLIVIAEEAIGATELTEILCNCFRLAKRQEPPHCSWSRTNLALRTFLFHLCQATSQVPGNAGRPIYEFLGHLSLTLSSRALPSVTDGLKQFQAQFAQGVGHTPSNPPRFRRLSYRIFYQNYDVKTQPQLSDKCSVSIHACYENSSASLLEEESQLQAALKGEPLSKCLHARPDVLAQMLKSDASSSIHVFLPSCVLPLGWDTGDLKTLYQGSSYSLTESCAFRLRLSDRYEDLQLLQALDERCQGLENSSDSGLKVSSFDKAPAGGKEPVALWLPCSTTWDARADQWMAKPTVALALLPRALARHDPALARVLVHGVPSFLFLSRGELEPQRVERLETEFNGKKLREIHLQLRILRAEQFYRDGAQPESSGWGLVNFINDEGGDPHPTDLPEAAWNWCGQSRAGG